MSSGPLNDAEFAAIRRTIVEEDDAREQLIKRSRDVLKCSKQAIYALQRSDGAKADALIAEGKEKAKELLGALVAYPHLRFGALSSALEEWAEAAVFSIFLKEGRIASMAELEILTRDEYLGGVMDFCGEINRFAVLAATRRDAKTVQTAREVVDALLAQLMLIEFRNGALRRKYGAWEGEHGKPRGGSCALGPPASPLAHMPPNTLSFPPADGVKYTLNKLEQICYDLSLSGAGFLPKGGAREAAAPAPSGEGGEGGEEEGGAAEGTGAGGGGGGGGKRARN
jgi:predicted translin family RNA/ssDNA-binding protein